MESSVSRASRLRSAAVTIASPIESDSDALALIDRPWRSSNTTHARSNAIASANAGFVTGCFVLPSTYGCFL